jgi:hypothetical protein
MRRTRKDRTLSFWELSAPALSERILTRAAALIAANGGFLLRMVRRLSVLGIEMPGGKIIKPVEFRVGQRVLFRYHGRRPVQRRSGTRGTVCATLLRPYHGIFYLCVGNLGPCTLLYLPRGVHQSPTSFPFTLRPVNSILGTARELPHVLSPPPIKRAN